MTAKSLNDPSIQPQLAETIKKQFNDLIDKNIASIAAAMESGIAGAKLNKHIFRFEVTSSIKDGKLHLDTPKTNWSIKKELCGESTTIDIDDEPDLGSDGDVGEALVESTMPED